jgi:predicted glutamine amidotransferase
MCIIVYKPKNVKLPDRKILRNCYLNNDDGAGYMFVDNGKVQIRKGFDDFNKFYKAVLKDYDISKSMVLHFRISTSGGINAGATHPFPLSYSFDEMKKTVNECNVGIAHNGVIRLTEPTTTESASGINDTMKFIKTYMNIFLDSDGTERLTPKDINLINNMTNSKLAILYNNDTVQLTNILAWKEQDGVYYSNDTFSYRVVYNYKNVNDAVWYSNYDRYYCWTSYG